MEANNSAYGRYLDAISLKTAGGQYQPEAIREMQAAFLDALRTPGPLPNEMRLHLAWAFEHLCTGIAYDVLAPVKRPGGRELPIAKTTQESGIRYLRWCGDGRIQDGSSTSTVATSYGVSTRTVRNWYAAWNDRPTPPLFEEYGPAQVEKFMRLDGAAYQRFKLKAIEKGRP